MTTIESVIALDPFTVRRTVRFGDCDPAGVVYTVRFSDYVVSAMDLFLSALLGGPYLARLGDVQTPLKALQFVFRAPLRPDDMFDMIVSVRAIRRRTFDLAIAAQLPDGSPIFDATVTPMCVTVGGERRSVAIPEPLRSLLQHHHREEPSHAATLSD